MGYEGMSVQVWMHGSIYIERCGVWQYRCGCMVVYIERDVVCGSIYRCGCMVELIRYGHTDMFVCVCVHV